MKAERKSPIAYSGFKSFQRIIQIRKGERDDGALKMFGC